MSQLTTLQVLAPSFAHLSRLTDGRGLFEHARHGEPRLDHGYCVDDVARALVVAVREPAPSGRIAHLVGIYLAFLESAVDGDGRVRNRMSNTGVWTDDPTIGDWWGRAVASLGFTARYATDEWVRTRAMYAFVRASKQRSPDVRASSFAALGAADVLQLRPDADGARALLRDCLAMIPTDPVAGWGWPEPRLRYANAALCEALIFGGNVLGRADLLDRGLELLAELLAIETNLAGRLSVTGPGGRGPGQAGPLWDQQAIEPAAIADACARAYAITGDPRWADGVMLAVGWFLGDNDSGTPMFDVGNGAGYDGLEPFGRNDNRGAESTIAAISTLQQARAVAG